jgi:putative RNA 2'-phosphotransferase
MNVTDCSKFLSFVLRHKPQSIGIELSNDGWVDVDELIEQANKHGKCITDELLIKVVKENNKKRFEFSDGGTMIRASQGHSVQVDLGYEEAVPPKVLYHGTADRFEPFIRGEGIKKMSRHEVHLSADMETAVKVGQRHGKPVVMVVDAAQMHIDGFKFHKSTNGVWLTDTVPSKYIL